MRLCEVVDPVFRGPAVVEGRCGAILNGEQFCKCIQHSALLLLSQLQRQEAWGERRLEEARSPRCHIHPRQLALNLGFFRYPVVPLCSLKMRKCVVGQNILRCSEKGPGNSGLQGHLQPGKMKTLEGHLAGEVSIGIIMVEKQIPAVDGGLS